MQVIDYQYLKHSVLCTNLKTVTIGKSVTKINSKAFAECKGFESIICKAENPPTTNSDAFENSYIENVTLYVPNNTLNEYKSKNPWSKFGKILTISENTNGLDAITYKGDNEKKARIYSLDGKKLNKPQKGVNIIRMNDGVIKKIVIK